MTPRRARHDLDSDPPRLRCFGRDTRARLVAAVLLAMLMRALIPLGFMPATDGSLSLMICPAGLPVGLLPAVQGAPMSVGMHGGMAMPGRPEPGHQHPGHPGHGVTDDGYCAFTTGFSAAPPPLILAALLLFLAVVAVACAKVPGPAGIRLVHLPPPRAPPVRV